MRTFPQGERLERCKAARQAVSYIRRIDSFTYREQMDI
jgi:hypothetical protein